MMVLGLVMALFSPQADGQDQAAASTDEVAKKPPFDEQALREALKVSGLQFTDAELAQLLPAPPAADSRGRGSTAWSLSRLR